MAAAQDQGDDDGNDDGNDEAGPASGGQQQQRQHTPRCRCLFSVAGQPCKECWRCGEPETALRADELRAQRVPVPGGMTICRGCGGLGFDRLLEPCRVCGGHGRVVGSPTRCKQCGGRLFAEAYRLPDGAIEVGCIRCGARSYIETRAGAWGERAGRVEVDGEDDER